MSPHNALVKALVDQGFTDFTLSWKNPGPEDREASMADDAQLGLEAALDAIGQVLPDTGVHALGYCLGGERAPLSDLMAWHADGKRLPSRMHSECLHTLFLDNALARGQARLDGHRLQLSDIRLPTFNVGAVQDQVAPWRSVFKLHALTEAERTFVPTVGGHSVDIVNPSGAVPTSHRLRHCSPGDHRRKPEDWLEATPPGDGTWWLPWFDGLRRHSAGTRKPPSIGVPAADLRTLADAPGRYELER